MTDFREMLVTLFGGEQYVPFEFPEFQPHVWWHERMDILTYQTRDCSYVGESFGWYFSVLLAEEDEIVGIVIEPFREWAVHVRKTYPGLGVDGRDFPLWAFVQLSTTEKCLFSQVSRERVQKMLPRIREFVGAVTVPFHLLQEVYYGKNMPFVS